MKESGREESREDEEEGRREAEDSGARRYPYFMPSVFSLSQHGGDASDHMTGWKMLLPLPESEYPASEKDT